MKKGLIFFLAGITLTVILAGCSTKTEETKTAVPTPPKEEQEFTDVPNAGEAWEALTIQVVETSTKKSKDYIVKIGGDFIQIENTNMKLKVEQFVPDFYMSGQKRIGSRSKDLNNPAASIVVTEEGKPEPFKGWIFSRYPDIHKGPSDKYSFRLKDFTKKQN